VSVTLVRGDATERWDRDDNSLDSIVTDPPYGISFMGKVWDDKGGPAAYQQWTAKWASEAFRCLKPGGFLLAFGAARMSHRMACGFEDAGFRIVDTIEWLYLTGFPKAGDIGKMFDKRAGAEREVVGKRNRDLNWRGVEEPDSNRYFSTLANRPSGSSQGHISERPRMVPITTPATALAKLWDGWKTPNLKPAHEPIVVAQRPFKGTYIDNIERWGVGGANIDRCRIATDDKLGGGKISGSCKSPSNEGWNRPFMDDENYMELVKEREREKVAKAEELGRFPANVVTLDPDEWYSPYFNIASPQALSKKASKSERNAGLDGIPPQAIDRYGECGQGATPQQTPRVTRHETNFHPTVKPVDLMRWLQRLVTPPGGVTASPFLGSGTDAVAAIAEGFDFWGVEKDAEYWCIIEARVKYAQELSRTEQVRLFDLEAAE
jgi:DNA modification methylase